MKGALDDVEAPERPACLGLLSRILSRPATR
jgi:hypothetical protein